MTSQTFGSVLYSSLYRNYRVHKSYRLQVSTESINHTTFTGDQVLDLFKDVDR